MHAPTKSQAARLLGLSLLVAAGAQVSACSDGGGATIANPPPPPPPPPPAMGAARFGGGFATSFAANANTDPREPMFGDIIPISLTTDPLDVP